MIEKYGDVMRFIVMNRIFSIFGRNILKECFVNRGISVKFGVRHRFHTNQIEVNGTSEQIDNNIQTEQVIPQYQRRIIPSINDPPSIRRPGDIVDVATVIRNWWAFPAVGFNSILTVDVNRFEVFDDEISSPIGSLVLSNDIFGIPIRPDILHLCYIFHRRALAGYTERMQLHKWEWPGSTKKYRSQKKSGKARMGWRKAPGKYLGVQAHPLRPHDQRGRINKRLLWQGLKIMLSAKFAQNQIKVVDSFNLRSHKTKYVVKHLKRLLGDRCNSALLVHEGYGDVNDNFRWACAHVAAVRRENVEGVNVYNLLKYRQLVITEKALQKLIWEINQYPHARKWTLKYATPDGKPAPLPDKVEGWNSEWIAKKEREREMKFNKELLRERIEKWKWSSELKGPLKIPRHDPLRNFVLCDFSVTPKELFWNKFEDFYGEDDLTGEENDEESIDHIRTILDERVSVEEVLKENEITNLEDINNTKNDRFLSMARDKEEMNYIYNEEEKLCEENDDFLPRAER